MMNREAVKKKIVFNKHIKLSYGGRVLYFIYYYFYNAFIFVSKVCLDDVIRFH